MFINSFSLHNKLCSKYTHNKTWSNIENGVTQNLEHREMVTEEHPMNKWDTQHKVTNWSQQTTRSNICMQFLSEIPYLRNARWWMVGEHPPKQSSRRNFATSSGDSLESFLCTPSKTRIVAALVSITTSNCNNKKKLVIYISYSRHITIKDIRSEFEISCELREHLSGM